MREMAERALPPAAFGLIVTIVIHDAARPISDPDSWWHLRLGDLLLQQGVWGDPPAWSQFGTRAWTLSEPLPEMVAALVERHMGLPGLAWLYGAACVVLAITIYVCSRALAGPVPAALTLLVAYLGAYASITSRPQLISFILIPIVITAWLRLQDDHRLPWWLIPMCVAWAWCHGFWIVGAALNAVCFAGLVLEGRLRGARALKALVLVALTCLAGMATTAGWRIYLAPFEVRDSSDYIYEWQRTPLSDPRLWMVLLMVVTVWLAMARTRRWRWSHVLLSVIALMFALSALRMMAVGAVVVAPAFAEAVQQLARTRPARATSREFQAVTAAGAATLLVLALATSHTSRDPGGVPLGFDETLDRLPSGAVVLNGYGLGGWIGWRHPTLQPVIDELIVPFPNDYIAAYFTALDGDTGWEDFVAITQPSAAVLNHNLGLVEELQGAGWREVGQDGRYVLLLAPAVLTQLGD